MNGRQAERTTMSWVRTAAGGEVVALLALRAVGAEPGAVVLAVTVTAGVTLFVASALTGVQRRRTDQMAGARAGLAAPLLVTLVVLALSVSGAVLVVLDRPVS